MGRPSFIIIGAERCGTTSLYHNICLHSNVYPAYCKEIEFFDKHYENGTDWYEKQFDEIEGMITGEATPTYYWNPKAPERIRRYNPNIKLIFIHRDPFTAAKSKHSQQVSKGVESLSFKDALDFEQFRISGELDRVKHLPYNYYPKLYAEHAYSDRYSYSKHMINWAAFKYILKIKSEDFFNDMDKTMRNVFSFIGLPYERHQWEHLNKGQICAGLAE
jgi:lipopolysaccharide transport system ATP-binding protein